MSPRVRFIGLSVVFALVFYAALERLTTSQLALWSLGDATAAIAVMLAAQGFSWRRKLLFAGAMALVAWVLLEVVAHSFLGSAADALTNLDVPVATNSQLAAFVAVQVIFLGVPLAGLALFVGRRPSLLWAERDVRHGGHKKSARSDRRRT